MTPIEMATIIILSFFSGIIYVFTNLYVIARIEKIARAMAEIGEKVFIEERAKHVTWSSLLLFIPVLLYFGKRDFQDPMAEVISVYSMSFIATSIVCYYFYGFRLVRSILNNKIAGVFLWLIILLHVWLGRAAAVDALTSSYGIDATNFSLTLSIATFLKATGIFSIALIVIAIALEILVFFSIIFSDTEEKNTTKAYRIASVTFLFIMSFATSQELAYAGLSEKSKLFIVRIAFDYDFTGDHFCKIPDNIKGKVVFIGEAQDRALLVPSLYPIENR